MININGYVEDLQKYLASKLPDVDAHIAMEIVEYIGCRTSRLLCEAVDDRDKEWKRSLRQQHKFSFKKSTEDNNDNT